MIKDRKYHLKSYKRCFVGKELVDWLVANNEATDREEGLRIGRELLEAGCIHHGKILIFVFSINVSNTLSHCSM